MFDFLKRAKKSKEQEFVPLKDKDGTVIGYAKPGFIYGRNPNDVIKEKKNKLW